MDFGNLIDAGAGSLFDAVKDQNLSTITQNIGTAVTNASLSDLAQLGDLTPGQIQTTGQTVENIAAGSPIPTNKGPVLPVKTVAGVSVGLLALIGGVYFLGRK